MPSAPTPGSSPATSAPTSAPSPAAAAWRDDRGQRQQRQGEPTMSEIAYASGTSTVPLLGQTIGQNLAATAERHGDREALVVPFQDVRLSYAELTHEVERVARLLLSM